MKFSVALTSLLFILPLLVADADAAATRRKGGKNKNKGGNNASATASAAAANSTAVAANSTAVAANSTAVAANSTAVLASNNTANNNNNQGNNNNDPQTSLTLDPKVIAPGFASNGQGLNSSKPGQVASLTSTNNFINFCLTVPNLPITNGQQVAGGSCNPAPMGVIASTANMPSAKFLSPVNGQDFGVNTPFSISMNINHLVTGNFVNAETNYYSAPQQVNGAGDIVGHTHFTVNAISSFVDTIPNDPNKFAFFKGVNGAAVNGVVTESVGKGLPAGVYRLCSMNTDANHTPALVAVAQHGSLDDCVYFSVGGAGAGGNPFNGANSTGSVAVANNSTAAAGGNSTASGSAAGNSTASGSAAGNATAASSSTAAPTAAPAGQQGGKNQGGKKGGKKGGRGEQPFRLRRQY
ncbi:hypothetical protein BGW80DRAFT_9892 [Lactifluus volemus]|nr:hypothetical protein BGW80DRAFT_9892 [Lactifluus volemus]